MMTDRSKGPALHTVALLFYEAHQLAADDNSSRAKGVLFVHQQTKQVQGRVSNKIEGRSAVKVEFYVDGTLFASQL